MNPHQESPTWNTELAYVVGVITADGSLASDGRHIDITSKDRSLVELCRRCLDTTNKITKKRSGFVNEERYYRIQLGNIKLYKWLLEIGLTPNKSKTLRGLVIPEEYFLEFVREYLDGDGCIRVYWDPDYPESRRLYIRFFSSSKVHLCWLKTRLENQLGLNGGTVKKGGRAYILSYAKHDSVALLRSLYPSPEVPCLARKYAIAKEFL